MDRDRSVLALCVGLMREKHQLCYRIAAAAGVPPPPISSGSTEPKRLFELVSEALGLDFSPRLIKTELAGAICEVAGIAWDRTCWSTGGTVTIDGLRRVYSAVLELTSSRPLRDLK